MLDKQRHVNKPLASVSHSQVKLALNGTARGNVEVDVHAICASFVDHESTVSCVSVDLHRLPDRDKIELLPLGAWKWVRNGV